MNQALKTFVLCSLFALVSNLGFSQLSVSYYSSSLPKIGMGYNFSDRFWTELRVYANTKIDDLTPELVLCYNITKKEKHNVYIGLGGNANYFTGIVLPLGVQFSPFEKLDRFSFHIELQPSLDFETDLILQSCWGLRYKFGKK